MPQAKKLASDALIRDALGRDADPARDGRDLNAKVAVTGGAGFIGSHLCESLANLGHDVVVLDNLSTGTRDNILQVLESTRQVKLIVGDCKDPTDIRKTLLDVDIVYHFAANPEVRLDITDPLTCFRENVYATHVLLEGVALLT
jgi:UDP-glucose 4-epimerase